MPDTRCQCVIVKLAKVTMASRFELVLCGDTSTGSGQSEEGYLRAAGEEAMDEIERLESQMSLYRPDSELCSINARAAFEPVKVEPRLFQLLWRAKQLSVDTDGAFDITIAPLVRWWGFFGRVAGASCPGFFAAQDTPPTREASGKTCPERSRRMPDLRAIEEARQRVGMQHVILDAEEHTVHFLREGMMLDLGGIGKGYAIERAAALLREKGITSALLHGGTSTVYAIGTPPLKEAKGERRKVKDEKQEDDFLLSSLVSHLSDGWLVGIRHPLDSEKRVGVVCLRDRALSVSGVHGKSFEVGSKRYGHLIDPRTGYPARGVLSAAVVTSSPTDADALSTAFLVLGVEGTRHYCKAHPDVSALLVLEPDGDEEPPVVHFGFSATNSHGLALSS